MKKLTSIAVIILILIAYLDYIAREQILFTLSVAIPVIAILLVAFGLIYLIYYGLMLRESLLTQQEKRFQIGRDFHGGPHGEGWTRRPRGDNHSEWIPLHLNPSQRINGHQVPFTEEELRLWQAFHSRNKAAKELPMLIEGQAIEKQRNIFEVVDTGLHFSLIGPTNAGKTTLCNHIIDYIAADETIVCDPDTKFNTWSNRATIIRDYDHIKMKVFEVFEKMGKRYDPSTPLTFPTVLLCIDEYPDVKEQSEISQWIAKLGSRGRKVKIRLILMSQSDLVQDTDLNSAMRENFTKITMAVALTRNNEAYIRHWDKSKELITLAGPYEREMSRDERIIQEWSKYDITNEKEYQDAVTEITHKVFDTYGGWQRNKVIEVTKGLVSEIKSSP